LTDVLAKLAGVYVTRARARSDEDLALIVDGVFEAYGSTGLLDLKVPNRMINCDD
jgi:hypothetical protein